MIFRQLSIRTCTRNYEIKCNGIIITLLFMILRTLLLSSIQPEAEILDFLTHTLWRNL